MRPEQEKNTAGKLLVGLMIVLYAVLWLGAAVLLHAPGWRHVRIELYLGVGHLVLAVVAVLLLFLLTWLEDRKTGRRR